MARTTAGYAPFTATFTNLGTGVTNYSWNFGDGVGTSTSANPSYTYSNPGIYTVTFTAGDITQTLVVNVVEAAPIDGTIDSVSTVTGQVLLREPPRSLDLLGYIDGQVIEVHPKQGVTVETACTLIQGIFGIGGETWGELMMAAESPDELLAPAKLSPSMKGKIVVGGAFLGADTMKRIAAPMIGGIFTSFIMELCVYPAIYAIWKWNFGLKKQLARTGSSLEA